MLPADQIHTVMSDRFQTGYLEVTEFRNMTTIHVKSDIVVDALRTLKTDPRFACNFLADLTAIDHLKKGGHSRYSVVYHLLNQHEGLRIVLQAWVDEEQPVIASATELWRTADWQEREVYDLFGIQFTGHPNLTRILNPEDFQYHPLRKDYPLQGRGERSAFPVVKRTVGSKWVQVERSFE